MKQPVKTIAITLAALLLAAGAGGFWYFQRELAPVADGPARYIRFSERKTRSEVAAYLQAKGFLRNARVFSLYHDWKREPKLVAVGTYQVKPGMTADQILDALKKPVQNFFRIPETNPSYRTARLLANNGITESPESYEAFVFNPQKLQAQVSFPLPKDSLEGYLYPDTYDLPPLLGAEQVVLRQLAAFEKRILPLLPNVNQRRKLLTIASMVELEAGVDQERAKIAGVIYNRIERKMRLQIDATVLYGMRDWRRLYFRDYRHDSPFNTYRIDGLPPTPIASPSIKSVQAAIKPDKHNYLYYVAMPDRTHLFAETYEQHRRNIAIARKARESGAKQP